MKQPSHMELDQWKEQINRRLEEPALEASQEIAIYPAKSRSILMKFRRNLRIEIALYLLTIPVICWQAYVQTQLAIRIYDLTLLACIFAIMWKLRSVIRRVDDHLRSDSPIRQHLASLLEILQANSRYYLYLSVGLIPFFTIYAALLYHFFPANDTSAVAPATSNAAASTPLWVYLAVALILTALLSIIVYGISRLYIWWMFGKYIRLLQETIQDMEEHDTE